MMDFSKAYDRKEFVAFLQNEFLPEDVSFTDDPEAEVQQGTKYIKTISKLGTCPSLRLAVYEARNTSTNDARVGLSKEIFRFMANKRERKALVLFVPVDNSANYRFSLISIELNETETGNVKRTYSNPRRFSYYLGKDIAARTPKDYLIKKKRVLNEADLVSRFSVEILNDDFFKEYKAQYKKFCDFLQQDPEMCRSFIGFADSGKAIRDYVKKMLGRIVFLYFVQRKGWLNSDYRYMSNMFANASDAIKADFLDSVLEPMFFGLLNTPTEERIANAKRNNWDFSLIPGWENIPYLNGGLFEQDEIDKCKSVFPKEYFADLFDFFDTYNFTIDENDPDDNEVGIDPEMLGHIFENLLEDNKDKGAFYTPKEIVQYMCRESVIQYLKTHEPDEQYAEAIEHLIRDGEVDRVLQDKATAVQFTKWLSEVKVCDPAIGSGAFPMGVLNVLYHSRQLLYGFTRVNNVFSPAEVKREIIQNNIYGVDIEQGAVDIARLRFWLSLVVDETEPQPLPNLDYKIMQGNSLLESFMGYDLSRILPVNKDGKISKWATKQASIDDAQGRIVFGDEQDSLAEIQRLMRLYYSPENHTIKEELKKEIDRRVKEHIVICSGNTPSVIDAVEKIEDSNKPFFLWHLYFADVFQNGGFDIVIANPPYNELRDLSGNLQTAYMHSIYYQNAKGGRVNMFQFFYPLGLDILRNTGICCLITQNSLLAEESAYNNRKLIFDNCQILGVDSFPERDNVKLRVFESAKMSVCICSLKKIKINESHTFPVRIWKDKFMSQKQDLIISKREIKSIYPNELIIPICNNQKWDIVLKMKAQSQYTIIAQAGEIDMTKYKHKFTNNGNHQRVITGAQILRYRITNTPSQGEVIYMQDQEAQLSDDRWAAYEQPRIVMQRITGVDSPIRLIATMIKPNVFCANSTNYISPIKNRIDMSYLLGLLNSKCINFFFKQTSTNTNVTSKEIAKFPIPIASKEITNRVIQLTNNILDLKQQNINTENDEEMIDNIAYHLFNLSYDEVKIIDPATPITREEYEC